jgi:phospholipid transport system substrate-binding protein
MTRSNTNGKAITQRLYPMALLSSALVLAAFLVAANIAFAAEDAPAGATQFTASGADNRPAEALRDSELGKLAPASGAVTATSETDRAKQFILALGNRAITTLTDGALADQEREARLRHMLADSFDLDMISRLVLGRYWRVATAAERTEYRQLFETFILNTYVSRLSTFSGEQLAVNNAIKGKRGIIVVRSQIDSPKRPSMRIDWLVRATNGRYRVVDVAVEGISMAITQRSEFASIIQSSGGRVAGLIDALRQKIT